MSVVLPGLTALLALVFALALLDQWRERRHAFQLVWGVGMLFFAIASSAETLGALSGWNEALYRTWYLTGAVYTAGWLGLGTTFLLARTRFGYTVAAVTFLGGFIAFVARGRYPDAGEIALLILLGSGIVAFAIAAETYFQNERWPLIAAVGVLAASAAAALVGFGQPIPAPGYHIDPATHVPTGELIPPAERLLAFPMNIGGGLTLYLGALFSAYVFMPKRRVLHYSLDADQPGDSFLFNLFIAPVAITVNFLASLPGALRALLTGRIHSRVPATLLIALGALVISAADSLARLGSTELFQVGKLAGLLLIFFGFLVSIEVFREIRVPFTGRVLRADRREAAGVVHSEQPAGQQS